MAITDHDTVKGVPQALEWGSREGIRVVPGVEISARFDPGPVTSAHPPVPGALGRGAVHLLGYFIDHEDPDLSSLLAELEQTRRDRGQAMVERLARAGVNLDPRLVALEAGEGAVGRPHVARALVRAGLCPDQRTAFNLYLMPGKPGYVSRQRIHPREASRIIARGGGVPVLAHPGIVFPRPEWGEIRSWGIRGIEVRHPAHSARETASFMKAAREWGFLPTGGSDSHGPGAADHRVMGSVTVPISWVNRLEAEGARRRE